MVLVPRIFIDESSLGVIPFVMFTPATRPCSASLMVVTGFSVSTSASTCDTAPVRSLFFMSTPTTTTPSSELSDALSTIFMLPDAGTFTSRVSYPM